MKWQVMPNDAVADRCPGTSSDVFVVDKRRAVFVLVASLAYMVLFGFLYSTHSINAVPIVILDEDQTQFSRTLIQALDDSERFRIVQYPSTQEEMEQALNNKEALAAVQIPANFARDVKSNRSSTVMLMVKWSEYPHSQYGFNNCPGDHFIVFESCRNQFVGVHSESIAYCGE